MMMTSQTKPFVQAGNSTSSGGSKPHFVVPATAPKPTSRFAMSGRQTFVQSLKCAYTGAVEIFQTQRNARIHLVIGGLAAVAGAVLQFDAFRWAVLVVIIGVVLVAEGLNSAIEAVVDLASPQMHPLAKKAKDTAAGAVLLAAIMSVVAGVLLFGERLLKLL